MSSRTTSYRSLMNSSSQERPKVSIDLTCDIEETSKTPSSLSTHSDPDTPTRDLTRNLIDLNFGDEAGEFPSTPGRRSLKRKADWKPERTTTAHTPSKDSKRHKNEYDLTNDDDDDDTSPELTQDGIGNLTPASETATQANKLRKLIYPISSDDETSEDKTVDLTTDPDDYVIDVDDLLSDDDVQFTGTRRCLKEKKKRKVRRILEPKKPCTDYANVNGVNIEIGSCVEFQDGAFMKVCTIYPEQNNEFLLVGSVFTRVTETETLMPNQRDSQDNWKPTTAEVCKLPRYFKGHKLINEVCQRIKIATGEAEHDRGLWRRSARDVKRRRILIMTNQTYEDNCMLAQHVVEYGLDGQNIEVEGELRCRWKEVITNDEFGKVKEHRLERPTNHEVSSELFVEDEDLRRAWRGTSLNLAVSKTKPTMAEACCGAGGMTLGAQMAGLDVQVAFDIDADKIATHSLNFPTCQSMHMGIFEWIQWAENQVLRVDVLHLSPPCQPFSAACTTPNVEKSETNQAVLLACGQVIERVRPRVVTIEESDGLQNRHSKWFGALISQFTELGFSIRWACLKCNDFGVPQSRKRFFLIASAPGEDLPTFPEPTHEPGIVSIQRTLDELEAVHRVFPLRYHNPDSLPRLSGRTPYDANRLAKTITCKGGDNYHPSGLRNFTIQEYLALQTFPHTFQFPDTRRGLPFPKTEMKAQTGNAVPSLVGKAILGSVVRSIIASDERRLERFGGANENDAIRL